MCGLICHFLKSCDYIYFNILHLRYWQGTSFARQVAFMSQPHSGHRNHVTLSRILQAAVVITVHFMHRLWSTFMINASTGRQELCSSSCQTWKLHSPRSEQETQNGLSVFPFMPLVLEWLWFVRICWDCFFFSWITLCLWKVLKALHRSSPLAFHLQWCRTVYKVTALAHDLFIV